MKQINQIIVDNLLLNLEGFYNKLYYKELSKNIFYFILLISALFMVLGLSFYYFQIPKTLRYVTVYSVMGLCLFWLFWLILRPLLKKYGYLARLKHEKVFRNINYAFPEVEDKLKNALDLYTDYEGLDDLGVLDLEERSMVLGKYNFQVAVPQTNWRPILLSFLLVISAFFGVLLTNSSIFSVGLERFAAPATDYSTDRFVIDLSEKELLTEPGREVEINCVVSGEVFPEDVFINIEGVDFMVPIVEGVGSFRLKNPQSDVNFYFHSGSVLSTEGRVRIINKVNVLLDSVIIKPPGYTGLSEYAVTTRDGFSVLKGSKIVLQYHTLNGMDNGAMVITRDSVKYSDNVKVKVENQLGGVEEHILGEYVVYKDLAPQLDIVKIDSVNSVLVLKIIDDYGYKSLAFKGEYGSVSIPVQGSKLEQVVVVEFDLILPMGKGIFELCDNNGFDGSSCVVSELVLLEDLVVDMGKLTQAQKKGMESLSRSGTDKITDVNQLEEELKDLQQELKELNRNLDKVNKLKHSGGDESQKKLDQIKGLNKQVQDERVKKLLEEIEKALNNLDKEEIQKNLNQIEENKQKLLEDMAQNEELYEQYLFELQLENLIDQLEKSLEEQQEAIDKNEEVTEELLETVNETDKVLEEMDEQLKQENLPEDTKEQLEEIEKELEDSKNTGDKEKQNSAKKKTEELADKLQESLVKMNSGDAEDLEKLRGVLENLKLVSEHQELEFDYLVQSPQGIGSYEYYGQRLIMESFTVIEDSLLALASRVTMIDDKIKKELLEIQNGFELAERGYYDTKEAQVEIHQRKALTSMNELALLLDDIVNNMQQQMGKSGEGNCSKPGGGKPKPGKGKSSESMKALQKSMDALNKKIQDGEKGKSPGKAGVPSEGNSQQIGEMVLSNQAAREALRNLAGDLKGSGAELQEIKDLERLLEEQEQMLLNGDDYNEVLNRQKEIEIKMLELESAVREREWDSKRKSTSATEVDGSNGNALDVYIKEKLRELEVLRSKRVKLNGYYKERSNGL